MVVRIMSENLVDFTLLEFLIILILHADNETPIKGMTWLQKIVFILNRNIDEIKAIFDGYYIGPYSEQVELIVNQFRSSEYLDIDKKKRICLTQKGRELASRIIPNISEERLCLIEQVKQFMNDMTKNELIAFIYSSFEEYTHKSDVLDVFFRTRERASFSLYKKGKVSIGKAAEIAGLNLSDFIDEYKKHIRA